MLSQTLLYIELSCVQPTMQDLTVNLKDTKSKIHSIF